MPGLLDDSSALDLFWFGPRTGYRGGDCASGFGWSSLLECGQELSLFVALAGFINNHQCCRPAELKPEVANMGFALGWFKSFLMDRIWRVAAGGQLFVRKCFLSC